MPLFFDTVNHDVLMNLLGRSIADKRLLALIGRYLRAAVLVGEHVEPSEVGTPQGGPITPRTQKRTFCCVTAPARRRVQI